MGGSRALLQASHAGTHTTGGGVSGGWQQKEGDIQKHASVWASQRESATEARRRMLPAATAECRLGKSLAIVGATAAVQTKRGSRVGVARCQRPENSC
eukprot:2979430-Pleurochrysis_carterae.AAC.3